MTAVLLGRTHWGGGRNVDGHREWDITHLVGTTNSNDGPSSVMVTPGLPTIGSAWIVGNDFDTWAFCTPEMTIRTFQTQNDAGFYWSVQQRFTTEPQNRCQDTTIEDPLSEPHEISGSFVKYSKEATEDKDGKKIENSAFERMTGRILEVDDNRPTVSISKNFLTLPLTLFTDYIDTVNDEELWGLGPRKVKLSAITWRRQLYGVCSFYYTINYDFDINFNTHDRMIQEDGTLVLGKGGDATDPDDYIKYKNKKDEEIRVTYLKYDPEDEDDEKEKRGRLWDKVEDNQHIQTVKLYQENNFLLLGIPTSL